MVGISEAGVTECFGFRVYVGGRFSFQTFIQFVFFVWKVCRIDDGICNFHELTRRNGNMAKTVHARSCFSGLKFTKTQVFGLGKNLI